MLAISFSYCMFKSTMKEDTDSVVDDSDSELISDHNAARIGKKCMLIYVQVVIMCCTLKTL